MEEKWKSGDECYIVENNMHIRPAVVIRISGGFCTLRLGNGKGMRVRESRLYRTPDGYACAVQQLAAADAL